MTSLLDRFRQWVIHMEEQPLSLPVIAGVLCAVIAVRNFIEIQVAGNLIYSGAASFIHYPLAYVGPYLALTVTLSLGSTVPPSRVGRLMMFAWLLTLIPPLADLILPHDGEIPAIGYLYVDAGDIPWTWLHFFNPGADFVGTTKGIRIEAFLAVLLGAFYAWLRSGSVLRAAATAVGVYFVSLFFFTLPALVVTAAQSILRATDWDGFFRGGGILMRSVRASPEDSIAIMWLVPVVLLLTSLWRWQERRLTSSDPVRLDVPLPGVGWFLGAVALAGVSAGAALHFADRRPNPAAYDILATVGLFLAVLLLARVCQALAATRVRSANEDGSETEKLADPELRRATYGYELLLAGAAVCLICGLGRSVAVPLAAATLPLFALTVPAIPAWIRAAIKIPTLALCTLFAFYSGIALVVGDPALARTPFELNAMLLIAGAAIGVAILLRPKFDGWLTPVICALGFGLAGLSQGAMAAAGMALAGGLVAGLAGRFADLAWSQRPLAGWGFAMLGIVCFQLFAGAVNSAERIDTLAETFRCNARLEALRGMELLREKGWKHAQTSFQRALKCDENYLPAMSELGKGLIEHDEDMRRGLPLLEKAVELYPDQSDNLTNLAVVYMRNARYDEAKSLMERAIAIHPRDPDVMLNYAVALESSGDLEGALAAWSRFLDRTAWRSDLNAERQKALRQKRQLEGRLSVTPRS